MGTWLRNLSNRTCWLRHRADMQELFREHGFNLAAKGKIPDPWDDFPRKDQDDRGWKRHRKTQYRVKTPHTKIHHPKVKYNSDWCYCGRYFHYSNRMYAPQKSYADLVWHSYEHYCIYGSAHSVADIMKALEVRKIHQFRVRSAYRKHEYEKQRTENSVRVA